MRMRYGCENTELVVKEQGAAGWRSEMPERAKV